MRYAALFELAVRHGFSPESRNADLVIEPSERTRQLLRNHRLATRTRPGGVQVVAPLDDHGELFIPVSPGTTLEWRLTVSDPHLVVAIDPASLGGKNATRFANGESIESGRLSPTAHPAPGGLPPGTTAAVEISIDRTAPMLEDPPRFEVHIEPSRNWWAYYLLTDLPATAGTFTIVDGGERPITFGAGNTRDLAAEPDPADPLAVRLAERHPSLRRIRFRSDDPVAASGEPRRSIELHLDGQRFAGPLANPRRAERSALSVTVQGGVERQQSLTHVLRYPNRPSATQGV